MGLGHLGYSNTDMWLRFCLGGRSVGATVVAISERHHLPVRWFFFAMYLVHGTLECTSLFLLEHVAHEYTSR